MAIATPTPASSSSPGAALLRRNFAWCLTGNYVFAACQALIVIMMAKFGTTEMLGQFALGLAISTPLIMLFDMQLRAVQSADAAREWAFRDCFGMRVLSSTVASALAVLVAVASGLRCETVLVVSLVALSKAVESVSDVCYGLFQRHERLKLVSFSMMLRGLLAVAAISVALMNSRRMSFAMLSLIVVWLVVVISHDLPQVVSLLGTREVWPRFDPTRLRALALVAFPLGVATMLLALNQSIPRYFVQYHFGETAVGIYAALAYTSVAAITVVDALGHAMMSRLSHHFEAVRLAQFQRLTAGMILGAFVLGASGIAIANYWGEWLLAFVYRPEYARHATLLLWVMIGTALAMGAAALMYALTSMHVFRPQAWLLGLVVGVAVGSCAILVPRFGLVGGAIASTVAGFVLLCGAAMLLARELHNARRRLSMSLAISAPPPAHAPLRGVFP
jgi:O-antigen/teichoic acid export membrane protein